jgi:nicotinamidase-related amidase
MVGTIDLAAAQSSLLNASDSVFVLIDMQQRLTAAMPDFADSAIGNCKSLLTAADALAIPVIVTEQYPRGLGNTIAELNKLIDSGSVIEKTHFSCAQVAEFVDKLNNTGRNQIVLAGLESHICILQTALDLSAQGFQVHVLEDAVCSRNDNHKINAIERMRQAVSLLAISSPAYLNGWQMQATPVLKRCLS